MGGITSNIEPDRIEITHQYRMSYLVAKVIIKRDFDEYLILSWNDTHSNIWIVMHICGYTFDELMNLATRGQITLSNGAILSTDDNWFKYEHGGMITIWHRANMANCLREALIESQKHGYTFKQ